MTDYFFVTNLDLDFEGRAEALEERKSAILLWRRSIIKPIAWEKANIKRKQHKLALYTVNEFELFSLLIF